MLPFGALEAPRFFCAGRSAPQLRREVAQCRRTAFTWARETPKCRATTGIGVAYCTQPCAAGELLSCADAALYEAKGAGRDTFRVRNLAVLGRETRSAARRQWPGHRAPARTCYLTRLRLQR